MRCGESPTPPGELSVCGRLAGKTVWIWPGLNRDTNHRRRRTRTRTRRTRKRRRRRRRKF